METPVAGPSRPAAASSAASQSTPAPAPASALSSSTAPTRHQQGNKGKQKTPNQQQQDRQNQNQQHQNKAKGNPAQAKASANAKAPAPALNMHTINVLVQSAAHLAARDAVRAMADADTGSASIRPASTPAANLLSAPKVKRLQLAAHASDKTIQALSLAKKSTLRLDPSIKRTICKRCHTFLIPGLTELVRYKASGPHGHVIVHTCVCCSFERSFPAPPRESGRGETRKRIRVRKRKEEAERREKGARRRAGREKAAKEVADGVKDATMDTADEADVSQQLAEGDGMQLDAIGGAKS